MNKVTSYWEESNECSKQAAYICPVFHWSDKQVVQPQTHATCSPIVINVLLDGLVTQTEQCFDSTTVFTVYREIKLQLSILFLKLFSAHDETLIIPCKHPKHAG